MFVTYDPACDPERELSVALIAVSLIGVWADELSYILRKLSLVLLPGPPRDFDDTLPNTFERP